MCVFALVNMVEVHRRSSPVAAVFWLSLWLVLFSVMICESVMTHRGLTNDIITLYRVPSGRLVFYWCWLFACVRLQCVNRAEKSFEMDYYVLYHFLLRSEYCSFTLNHLCSHGWVAQIMSPWVALWRSCYQVIRWSSYSMRLVSYSKLEMRTTNSVAHIQYYSQKHIVWIPEVWQLCCKYFLPHNTFATKLLFFFFWRFWNLPCLHPCLFSGSLLHHCPFFLAHCCVTTMCYHHL